MPRYFIDTDDGDLYVRDDAGSDFPDRGAARKAALAAIPDMAAHTMPDGDRRVFLASVRDAAGTVLYTASLSLVGTWHVAPSVPEG